MITRSVCQIFLNGREVTLPCPISEHFFRYEYHSFLKLSFSFDTGAPLLNHFLDPVTPILQQGLLGTNLLRLSTEEWRQQSPNTSASRPIQGQKCEFVNHALVLFLLKPKFPFILDICRISGFLLTVGFPADGIRVLTYFSQDENLCLKRRH